MKKLLTGISLFTILLYSCESSFNKNMYLQNFQKFIENIEVTYMESNDEDWRDFDKTFEYYSVTEFNRFKEKLTAEEKQTIDILIGRYGGLKVKYKAQKATDWLKRKAIQGTGLIEELLN